MKTTFLKSKKPSFSYTTSHYTKFTTMWKWHFYSLKSFLFYKQHHKNTCLSLFQRKTDSKEISNFWLASHAGVFRGVRWKTSCIWTWCSLRWCNYYFFAAFQIILSLACVSSETHKLSPGRVNIGASGPVTKFSKIQLVFYYQCCVLIGWAITRLYVIAP